jgi:D-serine deaminase-like pyridoxal phosphate-dependent protein
VATALAQLETPALLLDSMRMERNIVRMRERITQLGVALRPHVKTNKSIDVTRRMLAPPGGPITVSTLREAEYFAGHGITDILYAVGITPNKLPHVLALRAKGVRLSVILDNCEAARAVVRAASLGDARDAASVVDGRRAAHVPLDVLLEIDCDGHRSGLPPDSGDLLRVAEVLRGPHVNLLGVMTHAGSSYNCKSADAIRAVAEQERAGATRAATRLRDAGYPCPTVSVGSTPTATFADDLTGVTEVRVGVYVFYDLVMAGLSVCAYDDIALSVLTAVIGHQRDKGWTIVDAGWMAMSRDRGTSAQAVDQGYGLVCDLNGGVLDDYTVSATNQEHGIISHRSGDPARMLDVPVGTLLRILPNHACATAAQHGAYHVLGDGPVVEHVWERFSGW